MFLFPGPWSGDVGGGKGSKGVTFIEEPGSHLALHVSLGAAEQVVL